MSNNTKFKLNVTYLEDNISSLCNDIFNMDNVFCYANEVETLHKSHEEIAPDQISVYSLNNGPLKSKSLLYKIFGSFYLYGQRSISTKITKKFPGVIVLPNDAKCYISEKIAYINNIKKECSESFHNLANNHEDRFKIAHDIFPMLISFQVFRDLQLISNEGRINSINFYWRETMITKQFNKAQLLDFLYNKKAFIADKKKLFNKNIEAWGEIDSFIDTVNDTQENSRFRIKRHSSIPSPAANIAIETNNGIKRLNMRSSIPYIIFEHPKKIMLLNDYEANHTKSSNRLNKSKYVNLIPSINLEIMSAAFDSLT